jgi:hypothetical protein
MAGIGVQILGRHKGTPLGSPDPQRLATSYTDAQMDWLKNQSARRGITVSAMVRMIVQANVDRAESRK